MAKEVELVKSKRGEQSTEYRAVLQEAGTVR